MLGEILLKQGNAEGALAEMRQEPVESYRLTGLAMAYHALGQETESDAALNELIRKYGRTTPYWRRLHAGVSGRNRPHFRVA